MGMITALGKSIENAQLLRLLHQEITNNNAAIECRDDLNDQLTDIAQYMKDTQYLSLAQKKRRVNLLSGLLALPVFFFCLLLFSTRLDKWFGTNISHFSDIVLESIVTNYWLIIIYGILLIGCILYFYLLQKKSETHAGKLIDRFITAIKRSH